MADQKPLTEGMTQKGGVRKPPTTPRPAPPKPAAPKRESEAKSIQQGRD